MKIRALIVDDETLARERIRRLLTEQEDLEVIGECSNGPEAITFIHQQRPDLVFLDVQMPEVSGFDVLRALPPAIWPAIIFVTAHDQYAIEAFEVQALDYLLKPFTKVRLSAAVQRFRQHLHAQDTTVFNQRLSEWLKSTAPGSGYLNRITVKNGNQTLFVKIEDIDYIEAAGNYAVLQTSSENHVLRETLNNLEARLPPRLFLRISRSIIVNLERVKGVQSPPAGDCLVLLRNGRQLVTTRGIREIQERLGCSADPLEGRSP